MAQSLRHILQSYLHGKVNSVKKLSQEFRGDGYSGGRPRVETKATLAAVGRTMVMTRPIESLTDNSVWEELVTCQLQHAIWRIRLTHSVELHLQYLFIYKKTLCKYNDITVRQFFASIRNIICKKRLCEYFDCMIL